MSNPIAYAELQTKDLTAAKKFYVELFDWRLEDAQTPMGTYSSLRAKEGDGIPAGLFQPPEPAPSAWLPYVTVPDLVASTARAKRLGASVLQENVEVPGMGRFSLMVDPTGARFGLWQKLG
jgi:predicted enzyme related to lactoylglutathione lyase